MANEEQLQRLKAGVEEWNKWREENQNEFIDLRHANLNGADLQGASLWGADLREARLGEANLQEANLFEAKLQGAMLWEANLQDAHLEAANLQGAHLGRSNLRHADLGRSNLQGANLKGADLREAMLWEANLQGAHLEGADLREAMLWEANLQEANLKGADLQGVHLEGVDMTNTRLQEANLAGAVLQNVVFRPEHNSLYDKSEFALLAGRDRWLNWSRLRSIGQVPLFGVSYVSLILSLAVIEGAAFLEGSRSSLLAWSSRAVESAARWATSLLESVFEDVPPEWVARLAEVVNRGELPDLVLLEFGTVPVPERMQMIFIASLCLVVGTTFYKLACPPRIQEFSETEWVEEHGRARLQYFVESFRRKWAQWPTLIFTVVGGALGIYLVGERIVKALVYLGKLAVA